MIRAALISIIYTSSLDIAVGTVEVSSPASLMGADVERIVTRLRWVLSTAPNIIQVAVAFYILSLRLGPICLAPLPVVLGMYKQTRRSRFRKIVFLTLTVIFQLPHMRPVKLLRKQYRARDNGCKQFKNGL